MTKKLENTEGGSKMINRALLNEMIENDFVNVNKHPTHDLFIYNYSPKAQYERVWNEVTMMCRGLILDADYNIVARPFKKFFNLGEMENQGMETPFCAAFSLST